MSRKHNTIQQPVAEDGVGVARTSAGVAVFFVALLLLNGKGIDDKASTLEYGRKRDALLALTTPLRRVSEATRLCALRDATTRWAGEWLNGAE